MPCELGHTSIHTVCTLAACGSSVGAAVGGARVTFMNNTRLFPVNQL